MISVRQYEKVLDLLKDTRREEILVQYYNNSPFADTTEIAELLGYSNINAVNLQMGIIGHVICKCTGVKPKVSYVIRGARRLAYFTLLHDYYENGWELNANLEKALANRQLIKLGKKEGKYFALETEDKEFTDGRSLRIYVNRFERSKLLRDECLAFHKYKCKGCEFDFKKRYGFDIPDIIHVHHLIPLSVRREKYKCNPTKDLIPLCPNCHAVVHSKNKVMTIKELKNRIAKNYS